MARPRGAKARAEQTIERLAREYPGAECALVHDNPFQLLVATILSAQTTDENVNKVTPELFAKYPTASDLAHADPVDVERLVHSTGFFRSKAKNIVGMARALDDDFDGEVPTELDDLVKLPGVGRKTGNVVRSVAFDLPGLPDERERSGESRARSQRARATRGARPVLVAPDPPRPTGVLRAQAQLPRLRTARHLSLGRSRGPLAAGRLVGRALVSAQLGQAAARSLQCAASAEQ